MAQTTKRTRKRSAQAGVTLIEMLVVVTIIGLFVALVGPSLFKRADEAKVTVTRSQIDNFMTALGTYKLDTGTFPTTEQGGSDDSLMFKTLLSLSLLCTTFACAQTYQPNWESLDRRPTPSWFADAKFGIFIHWGVYSVPSYAPVLPGKLAYAEWYWHAITEGQKPGANPVDAGSWDFHKRMYGAEYDYRGFGPRFRAELFDPDHWADVFTRSGAKYVVLTSKHHEGFALWPSREASKTWGRPWNAVEIGPRRDLLGDLTT